MNGKLQTRYITATIAFSKNRAPHSHKTKAALSNKKKQTFSHRIERMVSAEGHLLAVLGINNGVYNTCLSHIILQLARINNFPHNQGQLPHLMTQKVQDGII
jgi:hypothetical protein